MNQLSPDVQKKVVGLVYVLAMFMAAMDGTIVTVAMVTISQDLQVPPSAMGSVNITYLVSLAACLPISGWLGDRYGSKRIFLLAIGIFTVASALCGMATNLTSLNLFRALQGVGGGWLTPLGLTILLRRFSPSERIRISRYLMVPIALAPAMGPILGGFLVDFTSWHWIFYVNLPVGVLCLLLGSLFLQEYREEHRHSFDLPGFLLSAPGLALTMYAFTQGTARGWSSPEIGGTLLLGLLLSFLFFRRELRGDQPMLNVRLYSERLFRQMGWISLLIASGLQGMIYIVPLMYQDALGASAFEAGLTTFPEALGLMAASQLVPILYERWGPRRLMVTALICAIGMFGLLCTVQTDTNPWMVRLLLFFAGFFLGHGVGVVQASAFNRLSPSAMGHASTLFHVQNRLGAAIGMVSLTGILAGVGVASNLNAYKMAILGAILFLIAALGVALRFRDEDALVEKSPNVQKAPVTALKSES